jgi:CheY-like chemotaxis protein
MARVLVVEDEANIRKFVVINLSARGYEVVEAETVREGLDRLRDTPPDVLLLDIKLPDMPGWELLRILADDPALPKIPVVIITASIGSTTPAYKPYENLVKVLVKPVSVQELTDVVREALN